MRAVLIVFIFMSTFLFGGNCDATQSMKDEGYSRSKGYIPKHGFVPDKKTAVRIAIAVLLPIYGSKMVESEKPFRASLKNGIWKVVGSLPEGHVGGVAEVEISKATGRIIRVVHFA